MSTRRAGPAPNNGLASPNLGREPSREGSNGLRPVPRKHRALKACDYCKKGKRKCFKPSSVSILCVTCTLAKVVCSLEDEYRADNPHVKIVGGIPQHLVGHVLENSSFPLGLIPPSDVAQAPSMSQKLDLILEGVSELLAMASERRSEPPVDNVKLLLDAAQTIKRARRELATHLEHPDNSTYEPETLNRRFSKDDASILISLAKSFQTSPIFLISNSMQNAPAPFLDLFLTDPPAESFDDVISKGILSRPDVVALMDDFRSNYGRWVLFPIQVTSSDLVERVLKLSSLLLTSCCCVSLRFLLGVEKAQSNSTFQALMLHLINDLNTCILRFASFPGEQRGDIEFLQAIVVLSIYLTSLSSAATSANKLLLVGTKQSLVNFDSWYLSGVGLSTMISKSAFGKLLRSDPASDLNLKSFLTEIGSADIDSDQTLTVFRIYNHLVLVHLVACVVSGRMCMVDEIRLNYCTSALSLPSATNFDGRMVSEIEILLIAYNFIQVNLDCEDQLDLNYEAVSHEVHSWHEQWLYLFEQPTLQFVELCYHFCNLQIIITYLNCKNSENSRLMDNLEAVIGLADDMLLAQILSHSVKLVNFAQRVVDDSYFACLSDQVHFFFFYGSCCLLVSLYLLKQRSTESSKKWEKALDVVADIVHKYDRIASHNPYDILSKYKEGIIQCTRKLFPSYDEAYVR